MDPVLEGATNIDIDVSPASVLHRLHRPTVAFLVLVLTSLLVPVLHHDGELTSDELLNILRSKAETLIPTTWEALLDWLPMMTLGLLALFHTVTHDFAGVARSDGYRRWTAFCRYCESRIIMNMMAASSAWAALYGRADAVEHTLAAGFHLDTSSLLSVALVVQHYLLAHPKIANHAIMYTLLTVVMWANVAAQCYRMAVSSSAVDVLQAVFLTKAVWHAYMPDHFANSFKPWLELARAPQQRRALAERWLAEANSEAYSQVKQQEDISLDQV